MKLLSKLFTLFMAIILVGCTSTTQNVQSSRNTIETNLNNDDNILVVYYSATGTTERIANIIADYLSADTFVIEPVEPYSSEDLSWTNSQSRVSVEHDNPDQRNVELVTTEVENWDTYDVVYIGYPIWWQNASWVLDNFVKENDFTNKMVIPFATSQSSPYGQSGQNLASLSDTGNWIDGARFSRSSTEEDVQNWLNSYQN